MIAIEAGKAVMGRDWDCYTWEALTGEATFTWESKTGKIVHRVVVKQAKRYYPVSYS